MGHSRTPPQNTAGDGFPADLIDGYVRAVIKRTRAVGNGERRPACVLMRWPPDRERPLLPQVLP